jgi:hypothetical protein
MKYWVERNTGTDWHIFAGAYEGDCGLVATVYDQYTAEFVASCLQALHDSDKRLRQGNCTASEARLAHEAFLNACAAARSRWLIRPTP